MQKFILTFLFASMLLGGCTSAKVTVLNTTAGKDVFQTELENIYNQQYHVRRSQWLNTLQQESRNAETLTSLSQLELLLDNPDLDNSIKNQTLQQYFDRASLYMKILLFPHERETFLQNQIKNELIFELSSIFLHCTLADNALNNAQQIPPAANLNKFNSFWQNILSNQQVEYSALNLNDFSSTKKIPVLKYPLHKNPPLQNQTEYRKYYFTSARDTALAIYPQLAAKSDGKLPLLLLKLMYKTPYELNNHYANDPTIKKDFSNLILELVWLRQSEQLQLNMQNSFSIWQDFQKSVSQSKNISPEMLDGCIKSQLAFELAALKMLSEISLSPFSKQQLPQDNIPQLSHSRSETLQLIIKDLLEKI